ncbi:MAG: aminodeoxychorismate synthase component I [Leadbetterella sp.]
MVIETWYAHANPYRNTLDAEMEFLGEEIFEKMNDWGASNRPFLFVLGYDNNQNILLDISNYQGDGLNWDFRDGHIKNMYSTLEKDPNPKSAPNIDFEPIEKDLYAKAYEKVKIGIERGNSFLCNLTASSKIKNSNTLEDYFLHSSAKYKVFLKDAFCSFSPESFVKISEDGIISSFPMKGTINATHSHADTEILSNQKETYEHTTIVDLIRNDLSQVCDTIWVERFRYVDSIKKNTGEILFQVSSEIKGKLQFEDWKHHIGDIFQKLTPAGSITGAPKPETQAIIQSTEKTLHPTGKRNYYTGICGIFDGQKLSSCVLIRFIEKQTDGSFYFKSGGGITYLSDMEKEYKELIDKIYVPVL